jgi:hypothetical protein
MRRNTGAGVSVRPGVIALFAAALLAGCSLFGSDEPAKPAGDSASSEQILKKDCSDPKWKEQNLGLWYSVCRPSVTW